MYRKLYLILLVSLVFSANSYSQEASRAPVDWTERTPTSGLTPIGPTELSLKSETLSFRLLEDARHYNFEAEYHLGKSEATEKFRFGIPIIFSPRGKYDLKTVVRGDEKLHLLAASIMILINGRMEKCAISPSVEPTLTSISLGYGVQVLETWCIGELIIPPGGDNVITIQYTGELFFGDPAGANTKLRQFTARNMVFFRAGSAKFAAPPENLKIAFDPGQYAEYIKNVVPTPGIKSADGKYLWEFDKAVAAKISRVFASLDARQILRHFEFSSFNRNEKLVKRAAVSSVRAEGYSAPVSGTAIKRPPKADPKAKPFSEDYLYDGSPSTAWCSTEKNGGVDEMIELEYSRPKPRQGQVCDLEGFTFVPGAADNPAIFKSFGMPKVVRLSSCYDDSLFLEYTLPAPPRYNWSAAMIPLVLKGYELPKDPRTVTSPRVETRELAIELAECARIKIISNYPGADLKATCISEIAPLYYCRKAIE